MLGIPSLNNAMDNTDGPLVLANGIDFEAVLVAVAIIVNQQRFVM